MWVFMALYWYFAIDLTADSFATIVPDHSKGRVLTVRIITFIYSFIVAAWSYRYVAANSKEAFFPSLFGSKYGTLILRLGTFLYGSAIGILFYVSITICPLNPTCQRFSVGLQPLLGSLAIVTSVSFGGVLGWLTDYKYLKA